MSYEPVQRAIFYARPEFSRAEVTQLLRDFRRDYPGVPMNRKVVARLTRNNALVAACNLINEAFEGRQSAILWMQGEEGAGPTFWIGGPERLPTSVVLSPPWEDLSVLKVWEVNGELTVAYQTPSGVLYCVVRPLDAEGAEELNVILAGRRMAPLDDRTEDLFMSLDSAWVSDRVPEERFPRFAHTSWAASGSPSQPTRRRRLFFR